MALERRRRGRLDQPREVRRALVPTPAYDADAFGRLSERIARFIGTGRFLVYMTVFVVVWLLWNAVASDGLAYDDYPFIFLTLILSLQASYAAPLILLSQSRQEVRDRTQTENDRQMSERTQADTEYLARELAGVRLMLADVVTGEELREQLAELSDAVESISRRLAATAGD